MDQLKESKRLIIKSQLKNIIKDAESILSSYQNNSCLDSEVLTALSIHTIETSKATLKIYNVINYEG